VSLGIGAWRSALASAVVAVAASPILGWAQEPALSPEQQVVYVEHRLGIVATAPAVGTVGRTTSSVEGWTNWDAWQGFRRSGRATSSGSSASRSRPGTRMRTGAPRGS
jgi:hypothetical protein